MVHVGFVILILSTVSCVGRRNRVCRGDTAQSRQIPAVYFSSIIIKYSGFAIGRVSVLNAKQRVRTAWVLALRDTVIVTRCEENRPPRASRTDGQRQRPVLVRSDENPGRHAPYVLPGPPRTLTGCAKISGDHQQQRPMYDSDS